MLKRENSWYIHPNMKSQGEIEAAIAEGISRFEQEYMGRGPKDVRAHLIDDLILVRLKGVLTAAEQHLVKALQPEKGRDLLKKVRTQLIEKARTIVVEMIHKLPANVFCPVREMLESNYTQVFRSCCQ